MKSVTDGSAMLKVRDDTFVTVSDFGSDGSPKGVAGNCSAAGEAAMTAGLGGPGDGYAEYPIE
jgi:hypothetical protein